MIMNKYIQKLINEQFNISDIDFTDDDNDNNIFNKAVADPLNVYNDILNGDSIPAYIIEQLDWYTSCIKPINKHKLINIIRYYSNNYNTHSLNWLDVSDLTDLTEIFSFSEYTGDISKWDVSNVTDMRETFSQSTFNNDISQWDVHNVMDMSGAFRNSKFNDD